ncbi:MAG: ribbon-helix-helix protein, CopG family [Chloroflexi bacterium]|nr:ribbon-helix-helix protein, CopG family [Chloroflexota bacterium]
MKPSEPVRRKALAETVAAYGPGTASVSHAKLSITLPADLAEQVKAAAEESGTSVSGVIAAALRSAIARTEQDRLDAAIDAQNEENRSWAEAFLPSTSKLWSEIEW